MIRLPGAVSVHQKIPACDRKMGISACEATVAALPLPTGEKKEREELIKGKQASVLHPATYL